MTEDQLFYVGQKALIEKDGKVLVLHDPLGGYDLPGGKIQIGEKDFNKSLKREVREETGFEILVGKPCHTGYFKFSRNSRNIKNAGNKIYLVFFEAEYVSGSMKLSSEHDEYYWVDEKSFANLKWNKDDKKDFAIKTAVEKYFESI